MSKPSLKTRRLWVELPTRAVQVRARVTGPRALDPLARVLLRLVARRPRTVDELAPPLGLEQEFVLAALGRLGDQGRLQEDEHGTWSTDVDVADAADSSAQLGWLAVQPHDLRPIPELWLGSRPPRVKSNDDSVVRPEDEEDVPTHGRIIWPVFAGQLAEFCVAGRTSVVEWRKGDKGKKGRAIVDSTAVVRSLVRASGSPKWAGCWAAVDLIPRPSGPATIVLHQPVLDPDLGSVRAISDTLVEWVRLHLPETWRALESMAEELARDCSVALRAEGIEDSESVTREARLHAERRFKELGFDPDRAPPHASRVLSRLGEAQFWLVVSRVDPERHQQARDAYAHSVEELARALGGEGLPTLRNWSQTYWALSKPERKRLRKERDSGWLEARLAELGSETALGTIRDHVATGLKQAHQNRELFHRPLGAGQSFLAWLLAAIAPSDRAAADRHGNRIRACLQRDPAMLTVLADLIQVRNDVFHGREEDDVPLLAGQPGSIDKRITSLVATLFGPGSPDYSSRESRT